MMAYLTKRYYAGVLQTALVTDFPSNKICVCLHLQALAGWCRHVPVRKWNPSCPRHVEAFVASSKHVYMSNTNLAYLEAPRQQLDRNFFRTRAVQHISVNDSAKCALANLLKLQQEALSTVKACSTSRKMYMVA